MIRFALVAAIATTLLCLPAGAPARDVMHGALSAEELEIKTLLLQIIERFNGKELRPPENPGFTQDADFVNVEGRWMKGVDEIRRVHSSARTAWLKDAKIKLIELDIRLIRPDVAVVHQLHEMSGSRHPDGTLLPPHQQISTRILVKERNAWITTAFQNTMVKSN